MEGFVFFLCRGRLEVRVKEGKLRRGKVRLVDGVGGIVKSKGLSLGEKWAGRKENWRRRLCWTARTGLKIKFIRRGKYEMVRGGG